MGANINEVERIAAESAEVKYAVALSSCTAALHLCVKLAGERLCNYCFFLVVHNTDYSWSNLHERKSILYTRTTWQG